MDDEEFDLSERRGFQGCFVDVEIFLLVDHGKLKADEVWLWLNINSFHRANRDCYLSNDRLGKWVGMKRRWVQEVLTKLEGMGMLSRGTKLIKGEVRRVLTATLPRARLCAGVCTGVHRGVCTPVRPNTEESLNKELSPQAGTAREPLHPRWQRYAQTLGGTIALSRRVKHTPTQIRAWARWIAKLESVKGIEPKRIKSILKWFCTNLPANLDNRYYPVVRCGESFFNKFDKLENAKHRMELEAEANDESVEEGPDIRVTTVEDDGSPINFD